MFLLPRAGWSSRPMATARVQSRVKSTDEVEISGPPKYWQINNVIMMNKQMHNICMMFGTMVEFEMH